jgi:hypothetical protein
MPALAPPTVSDATPALAANLNLQVNELELINGELSAVNIKLNELYTKRVIRRGALTRQGEVSCTAPQYYVVDVNDTNDPVVVQGADIFPPGAVVSDEFPPGTWDVVVNFAYESDAISAGHTTDLVYSTTGTSWTVVGGSTDRRVGSYLIEFINSTSWRTLTFAVRITTASATDFLHTSSAISFSAFTTS